MLVPEFTMNQKVYMNTCSKIKRFPENTAQQSDFYKMAAIRTLKSITGCTLLDQKQSSDLRDML